MSFPDTILPAIKGDALEIDELVIRFRFKRRYRYLWLAISRLSRQVIGFLISDRSTKSLIRLWFSLPADYRRKLVYPPRGHPTSTRPTTNGSPPGSIDQATKAAAKPVSLKD